MLLVLLLQKGKVRDPSDKGCHALLGGSRDLREVQRGGRAGLTRAAAAGLTLRQRGLCSAGNTGSASSVRLAAARRPEAVQARARDTARDSASRARRCVHGASRDSRIEPLRLLSPLSSSTLS